MSYKLKDELDIKITNRARKFCDKNKLTGSYNTIRKYANLIMSINDKIKWEDDILSNPYKLMKLDGVGFKRADKIALQLNFPRDHEFRILAFVGTALEETSKGSTIIPFGEISTYMKTQLDISNSGKIIDTIINKSDDTYKILDEKYKSTQDLLDARFLTKTEWYEIEKGFYNLCVSISKLDNLKIPEEVKNKIISNFKFPLNKGQTYAINIFDSFNINILTGFGGTGKTTVTKSILQCLDACGYSYINLTPTGISSKVFSNSTDFSSSTIHSFYFSNGEIDTDWLILDECSMYSVDHIKMILRMINKEKPPRLLMIGDVGQLSPISVGDPFYSLIKLITCGRIKGNIIKLEEIMRASSETFIPHLCLMFTDGRRYDSKYEKQKDLANVDFVPLENDIPNQLLNIMNKNNFSFDNTLILIPQNTGDMGNNIVNGYLDEVFADKEILYKDKYKTFRKNSYCMNIKNNKNLDIFNGERIRLIEKQGDNFICEKIDDGRIIEYDEDTFKENVQLSYSLTVHKCQGITVENVIFVASNKFSYMNTKELVYTGLSRASKRLIILFDDGALYSSSRKKTFDKRMTFLGKISEMNK